ncbi:MAG: TIR domain-containing protein [Thiothrix sp.]|nr:MAG: TIR domain-containing protein [Thiothrix sp.]
MTDIFISYSHQDEPWKDALQRHLKVLQLHGEVIIWDDRQIEVGSNWLPAIETALEKARVALLLVSSDFLTSEFITRKEIPRLLQRREAEGLQIVPVIVKPCAWRTVPWLAALQGATKDNRPLSQYALGSHESEQALSDITDRVYQLLQASKQAEAAKQQAEQARLAELERQEQARVAREAEQQRLAQEQAEREAAAKQQAEQARLQQEAEGHRLAQQQAERAAAEQARQAELQRQREAQEQAERERLARQQAEAAERAYAEQLKPEQAAAAKTEKERLVREARELKKNNSSSGGKTKWLLGGVGISALVLVWAMQGEKPEVPIELPEMIAIPAGPFQMGCSNGKDCDDDEKPVRTVNVPALEMSKTEITFAQWDACVADGGCNNYKPDDQGWGRGSRPVINVSWNDAQNYAQWLSIKTKQNYALPTEAQWEYAARAGAKTSYFWGDDIGANQANCGGCGSQWDNKQTSPVGSFAANAWGLQDMHGNVWEWTQDCYHDSYDKAPKGGSAWQEKTCEYRVMRGGSWFIIPRNARSANRNGFEPTVRNYSIGFRISRTN